MYKKIKARVYELMIPFIKIIKYINWIFYINFYKEIKLLVGSGKTKYKGWFSTDIVTLDITKEKNFKKYFKKKKISKILAEHVLEHLNNNDLEKMVNNFYKYSTDNINIRIAVPDGFHSDPEYINHVKPDGDGEGAMDHKNLFNIYTLSELFVKKGFKAYPIEFWDETGEFHYGYEDDENGIVTRSFINDERNINGKPIFTSLIIDFKKH